MPYDKFKNIIAFAVPMKKLFYLAVFILLSAAALAQQEEQFNVNIIANPITGSAPLAVQFSANATDQIQSYAWDFNDDGTIDSTAANPSFTYPSPRNYLARLSATDANGASAEATQMIVVKSLMTVSITSNPTAGAAPLKVQFTAAATGQGDLTYNWDFSNDGTIDSTSQNPETTY